MSDIQSFEGLQTAVNTCYENCKSIQDYLTQLTTILNFSLKMCMWEGHKDISVVYKNIFGDV